MTPLIGRRALLGAVGLAAMPALGAKAGEIRLATIFWPGKDGQTLHGLMAIPARARGRQPAVLVLGDPDTSGRAAILLTRLAENGLIACTSRTGLSLAEASATLLWLGTNRYTAGKVGVLGFGAGAALVEQLAGTGAPFAARAIFAHGTDRDGAGEDVPGTTTPLLRLPDLPAAAMLGSDTGLAGIPGLARAIAFFKERLA